MSTRRHKRFRTIQVRNRGGQQVTKDVCECGAFRYHDFDFTWQTWNDTINLPECPLGDSDEFEKRNSLEVAGLCDDPGDE